MSAVTALWDTLVQTLHSAWNWSWLDSKQLILMGLAPVFILSIALEWLWMRRRGRAQSFTVQRVFTNMNLGLAYQVFELVIHAAVLMAVLEWVYDHRIANVPLNGWTALPLFLLLELCYYAFHRASHRIRWFWCAHVVHHTDEDMNLSTALRQSMLYSLTGYWLFFTPLMLIGLSPKVAMAMYAANLAYQFFVHTQAVQRLPAWFEWVFVTPSHHRAHHGRNPQYIDKNYGGVLIVFDRLFGTFEPEVAPVDYGIPEQIHSHNLWTLNVHEWRDMWSDVRTQPGNLWAKLQPLWRPPEWRDATTTTARLPDHRPQA